MRDYGKVHTSFWASETLKELDADAKLLALYLLTSPHTNMLGAFRLPELYVSEDLGWTSERFRNCLETLSEFAEYDSATKWVWVRGFLKFNRPENPNQWKAVAKLATAIPEKVSFRAAALETVPKPFLNIPVPAPAPVSVPDNAGEGESDEGGAPPCPHDEIIAAYHEVLPAHPRIRQWTPTRKAHLRARWREDAKRQSVDYWRRYFGVVAKSPFLTGQVCGPGKRPFLATLDWLVLPENFAKVTEGRYHDGVNNAGR